MRLKILHSRNFSKHVTNLRLRLWAPTLNISLRKENWLDDFVTRSKYFPVKSSFFHFETIEDKFALMATQRCSTFVTVPYNRYGIQCNATWYNKLIQIIYTFIKLSFKSKFFWGCDHLNTLTFLRKTIKNMSPHNCTPELAIQSCDTGQRVFYDSWQLLIDHNMDVG